MSSRQSTDPIDKRERSQRTRKKNKPISRARAKLNNSKWAEESRAGVLKSSSARDSM
jgi:alkylated DNA repair dioxygenase AlkB